VDLSTAKRVCDLVRSRGQKWVGEADALAVELDQASVARRSEADIASDSRSGLGDRDGRMRVRRRCEKKVATLRGKRQQTAVHEIVERIGHGQGLPGLDRDTAPLERTNDLERKERVPARRLVDLDEERTGERDMQVLQDDAMEGSDVEGTDLHDGEAAVGK
jgi:hypothetical protein